MSRKRPPHDSRPPRRRLLTADDLAELLATTRGAIYARHSRGGIPGGIRLGRTLRFDPDVIDKWITANTASAGDHR